MCVIKKTFKKEKVAGGNESPILASGVKCLSLWTDGSNEVEEEFLLTANSFSCYARVRACVFYVIFKLCHIILM